MPSHNDVPERALVRDGARARRHARARRRRLAARRRRAARRARRGSSARSSSGSPSRAARARRFAPASTALAGADAVLVIDADGQHPAEAIPAFVRAARRRRARDRRPLRRPRRDAAAAPHREPRDPTAVRARDRPRGARHAERDATAPGTRAGAAALGRLRGGDPAPPPRPARRRARRAGSLSRRSTATSEARSGRGWTRLRGAVGGGATARTSHTDARPSSHAERGSREHVAWRSALPGTRARALRPQPAPSSGRLSRG